MKIVAFEQGSPAWLQWRNGGIGSSDAALIAAYHGMCERASWMGSLNALYEEKVTGVSKVVENMVMRRGKEGEAPARQSFENMTGIVVMPLCAEMDEEPRLRASFDGITFDNLETVEIKCPSEAVHTLAKQGTIVSYYVPQVVHQALVAWGHPDHWPEGAKINFYSYMPETDEGVLVTVPASDYLDYARELYKHELAFLETLDSHVPPCGEEYLELAKQYLALDRQVKAVEKERDAIKDKMIALAKDRAASNIQGAGVTLIRSERSGSIDWPRLAAEYQIGSDEQERYRKKASTVWQVRTAKPGAAKEGDAAAQDAEVAAA